MCFFVLVGKWSLGGRGGAKKDKNELLSEAIEISTDGAELLCPACVAAAAPARSQVNSTWVCSSPVWFLLPPFTEKRRRALRALFSFSAKYLQLRGLFLVNESKEASKCRREAAHLTVLPLIV